MKVKGILVFILMASLIVFSAGPVAGKSVYLSANHHTAQFDAWNIGSTGLVSFQATYTLNHSLEPAGIGIDGLTGFDPVTGDPLPPLMFVTSEGTYGGVEIINPVTLQFYGVAPGPINMGGVDVDDNDNIIYAIQRSTGAYGGSGTSELYISSYNDDGTGITQEAHITLPNHGYGMSLALDDSRNILWVCDIQYNMVKAYDVNVSDWNNIVEIPALSFSVSHSPIDVTVDSKQNLLYTVGGWAGSHLISKYDVATGIETTFDMGSESGMGVAVDEVSGYVYLTGGGLNGSWGGDNLQVWDCSTSPFTCVQFTPDMGNPAGIAIANEGQVVINPINLAKNDVVQGVGVPIGQNFTYEITCDNLANTVDVTGVMIRDDLPVELDFISEAVDGVPGTGVYDAVARTVTWNIGTILAGDTGPLVELVVFINDNATVGETIYNFANIWGDEVDTTTVIGEDPDDTTGTPGTPPLPPALGDITGSVLADCPVPGTGLLGVEIDLYDSLGNLIANAVTDVNGYYEMLELDADNYTITIVTPLGYQVSPEDIPVTVVGGETSIVDFSLTCIEITANPRTQGFWKHQFGVATGGRGNAQIDATTLCDYLDLVDAHFNNNGANQVVIYDPPVSGLCDDKLDEAKSLLNLKGSVDMIDRARQQLMAMLLNVVAGNIHQMDVISVDGATVSQAITYCDNIIDDPSGDYEKAKTIADLINNNQVVPAGEIDLSTPNIAYKAGLEPLAFSLSQNYPNPFNARTAIEYSLPQAGHVTVIVYDLLGRKVATLVDAYKETGHHSVFWNASNASSGMYFFKLNTDSYTDLKKMTLLK